MRAVVQRVAEASVSVGGEPVGTIAGGVVVLLGVATADTSAAAERLAGKVARLRIFENEDGRFDRSLLDVRGAALVVSQFTLIADSKRQKGTRPDFAGSCRPELGRAAVRALLRGTPRSGCRGRRPACSARNGLSLVNDGPVTIVLDA